MAALNLNADSSESLAHYAHEPPTLAECAGYEVTAFGMGKVILLGEHSVVYGKPALAAPIPLGVRAWFRPSDRCEIVPLAPLDNTHNGLLERAFARAAALLGNPPVRIVIDSTMPVSMGLGSSAATAVACARALLTAARQPTSITNVISIAAEMEREVHGTPSGVDHTCSAHNQMIRFQRDRHSETANVRVVVSPTPINLVVAVAGERGTTHQAITDLRKRQARWSERYQRILEEIGYLTDAGIHALEAGDLEAFGDIMNMNHGLLAAMQVSSSRLAEVVYELRRNGALGAKLTGAGGDGGAVIGLFHQTEAAVAQLRQKGIVCFATQIGGDQ